MNDKEMNNSTVYPGVANPTKANDLTQIDPAANNFMRDPTTPSLGAGADPDRFEGHLQAKRTLEQAGGGVIEARPGIVESANIDPLNENSNKDDGWANTTARPNVSGPSAGSGQGMAASASHVAWGAANTAAGAAKMAYGTVLGDEATKQQGKDQAWGKQ
ncbi:hypothetical protein BKA70DRAFT_1247776 [Coprinopsis sp. MPI-PUGE-AT-0042]|nr:hypothetical protein BKA70DRAFT_1247776 [Coprinopsis sp. MPI-PUGE-AT-0042]